MSDLSPSELDPKIFDVSYWRTRYVGSIPGATAMLPADRGRTINQRYRKAGYGLGVLIFRGGEMREIKFPVQKSPEADAVATIWTQEQTGQLRAGSTNDALDSIGDGNFLDKWGTYLPGQNS